MFWAYRTFLSVPEAGWFPYLTGLAIVGRFQHLSSAKSAPFGLGMETALNWRVV